MSAPTLLLKFSLIILSAAGVFAGFPYGPGGTGVCTSIVVIESQPGGYFLATSETNYAFISPELEPRGWLSVSVNGKQVVILQKSDKIKQLKLSSLSEESKELIRTVRANFSRSLSGLDLKNDYQTTVITDSAKEGTEPEKAEQEQPYSVPPSYAGPQLVYLNSNPPSFRQPYSAQNYRRQLINPGAPTSASSSYPYATHNYYNLASSPLNGTLPGDVYQLDGKGDVLAIYSTTVAVKRKLGSSLIFRDHHYFIFSQRGLPTQVNSFAVAGDFVFLVFDDGSVLTKPSNLLDSIEQDLVDGVRTQLKEIANWQKQAAATALSESEADSEEEEEFESEDTGEAPKLEEEQEQESEEKQ